MCFNLQIQECHETLLRAVSALRGEINARTRLLKLPAEIFYLILDHLAEWKENSPTVATIQDLPEGPHLQSIWRNGATSGTVFIPLSQTCRHLRSVVLSRPLLWNTVTATPPLFHPDWVLRSQHVPLIVVVAPSKDFTRILDGFYKQHSYRIQELHLTEIGHRHFNYLKHLIEAEHPLLRRLFVDGRIGSLSKWSTHSLPIPEGSASHLRVLCLKHVPLLPTTCLPHLTHLALQNVVIPQIYRSLLDVFVCCPSLESLILSLTSYSDSQYPDLGECTSLPKNLRRVTFYIAEGFSEKRDALRFCLLLLSPLAQRLALQVLEVSPHLAEETLLLGTHCSRQIPDREMVLAFSAIRHDPQEEGVHFLSATLIAPQSVFNRQNNEPRRSEGKDE